MQGVDKYILNYVVDGNQEMFLLMLNVKVNNYLKVKDEVNRKNLI